MTTHPDKMALASKPTIKQRVPLIIPVEGQVREFDAKLLLACVAARRNFTVVIGRLKTINAHIGSFPRSIYLAKGIAPEFIPTFRTLHELGHTITGWDEEALVHLPLDTYFEKRMSPDADRYVSKLFAWGQENADLWRSSPHYSGIPIHVTGNPRGDLLRPEMRSCFENELRERRRVYGEFFLINTNFSMVNSNRALFLPVTKPGAARALGPAAVGMTRQFAEQMERHKLDIFERFQEMIPKLTRAFPNINLVIRPHPSENPQCYHNIAAACERVHVVIDGNVIPWLLAAKATIHNGCTTAVEASLVGAPTVSFGPTNGEGHEFGRAWRLPDLLSYAAEDFEALREKLEEIVTGELGCFNGPEREKVISEFLTSQEGALACEKIVDVLEECQQNHSEIPPLPRLVGSIRASCARWRFGAAKIFTRKSRKAPEARRAAYHDLSPEQLYARLDQFQCSLGDRIDLTVEKVGKYIYRITRS
jgi:surface carbohydrate biosynthesis protein